MAENVQGSDWAQEVSSLARQIDAELPLKGSSEWAVFLACYNQAILTAAIWILSNSLFDFFHYKSILCGFKTPK